MFDNLKTKLKGLFKKAPAEVAEPDAPAVPEAPAAQPVIQEAPKQEPVTPVPEVKQEPAPALSRKEQLKAEKEAKKAAKKEEKAAKKEDKPKDASQLVTDAGGFFDKKIKEDSLEDLLWELELALMEADVALPVVEEIKEGVKQNLLGKKYSRGHTLE